MPYHWVRLPGSDPKERRDQVRKVVERHAGRLVENEIFYEQHGRGNPWALLQGPPEMFEELRVYERLVLLTPDER